ncbi:MAG: LysM peptidoglycan-binding domain-containing protein [Ardenticatenaceae bacterium]|nr:LysM peptidoglycan-binding domain-containing protein [Anaerolineales bacterium]MCB8938977.1 LysM peptidoglycan-binding domain-containing protein [Ardenticatenaceae bacterium]MCB8974733.1 LysM peptidoglycan-binding domain-containing protein [Ardenticatenaceae bacterium]
MPNVRSSVVLVMIAIAIIMAAGVFLAINVVQNRDSADAPAATDNNFVVNVGGQQVSLQVDPNSRPNIVDAPATDNSPRPEEVVVQDQQVQEATATPEPTAVPPTTDVSQATAVPAIPAVEKIIYQPYQVQQGDTLYSLSQAFATSIALMADKGISQANLVPGTTINIPVGNPEFCSGRGQVYAVGEGDTAFNISQRYNTTPENLQTLNQLDANYTVKIADIICVP